MERAAQIRQTGGPDVIAWTDVELAAPGPGEVRMRNLAVGLNFIDTYHRGGLYPMALPSGLGMEAAGIIEAVGDGVTDWRVGDRVATFGPSIGAYATARNIAAHGLFLVPDDISDEIAAAGLLKGFSTFVKGADGQPLFVVSLPPEMALQVIGLAFVAGILAAVAPARRAARMDPAQAIRM